jgi:AbrB family looped-hinge helix DNA binding protein
VDVLPSFVTSSLSERFFMHQQVVVSLNEEATIVTVRSRGRITIPKDFRVRHQLQEGEEVSLVAMTDGILIEHAKPGLRGILAGKLDLGGFEKDLRELRSGTRLQRRRETKK